MKIKTYLRVAKTSRGYKVSAQTKPNHAPLYTDSYSKKYLPTVHFAINLDIPNEAFDKASKAIAEINVPEEHLEINAETEYPRKTEE